MNGLTQGKQFKRYPTLSPTLPTSWDCALAEIGIRNDAQAWRLLRSRQSADERHERLVKWIRHNRHHKYVPSLALEALGLMTKWD